MKKMITHIETGSVADKNGIKPGWEIVSLGGNRDFDIIDYMLITADRIFDIEIMDETGRIEKFHIENPDWRPVGIAFENLTIDEPRQCKNKCIFCFMDQMPTGLRKTLYFKDDDYRLSFTCGNYVTLTNVKNEEIERIIEKKLTPMNISVHTTDPDLRTEMMKNPNAKKILSQLQRLKDGGIELNLQLVLCPGYNDKEALKKTLEDMLTLIPALNSLSAVPVGLTKYRANLTDLKPFDKHDAAEVIGIIEKYREKANALCGRSLFHASDEFFILADMNFPHDEYYEDYNQYENGVGIARSFIDEIDNALMRHPKFSPDLDVTLITGELAYPILQDAADKILEHFPEISLDVIPVQNNFFGGHVNVAGLVCGCDIIEQLIPRHYAKKLIIPSNMLNEEDKLFLDNISVHELEEKLGVECVISSFGGNELINTLKRL